MCVWGCAKRGCIVVLFTVDEIKTRLAGIAGISVGVCAVRIRVNALHAATPAFICGWGVAHRVAERQMIFRWREAQRATEEERVARLAGRARISVGVWAVGIRANALGAATGALICGWGAAGRGTGKERSTRLAAIARISLRV